MQADPGLLPRGALQEVNVEGTSSRYFTLTFTHPVNRTGLTYEVQFSTNLREWTGGAVMVNSTENSDGTVTETWRSPEPVTAQTEVYARLRIF